MPGYQIDVAIKLKGGRSYRGTARVQAESMDEILGEDEGLDSVVFRPPLPEGENALKGKDCTYLKIEVKQVSP